MINCNGGGGGKGEEKEQKRKERVMGDVRTSSEEVIHSNRPWIPLSGRILKKSQGLILY